MRLSFPVGVTPGFNPQHIAGGAPRFSGISNGSNFISLLQGANRGTIGGGPVGLVDGIIGPATNYSAATDASSFSGQYTAAIDTSSTIGAIFVLNSVASANQIIFSETSNGTVKTLALNISSGVAALNYNGVTSFSSSISVVVDVPYFLVSSVQDGNIINFALTNLRTGQVRTSSIASSQTRSNAQTGTNSVGTRVASNLVMNGKLAAVMFNAVYLPLPALIQWANDPWSFWYPQRVT